ncbi:LysR family transcriptional regulator [Pusillimonas sp. TS35]|uniref:LysR family transcriptional regulator n=1 Tax=Paracandidimonas lactea TaxID=2895524 RepID=UPI00136E3BFD|nr:LysR family transcriptional regulator [Paracandidimonas lactea]MYN12281.1 LysR family transcriptional regulator [Pusillimonas sp. TS35]
MHYELKDLRLFQAIAEVGNLSTGAAAMHMTASSASYRLKNLEYAVGSPVFLRTPKGMKLTPAGEVLAKHARKLLSDVETMHRELGDYSTRLRGSVRLLANSSSLNSFIIPSLARFLVSNASINVDLKEKESPTISQAIEEGQADIGVGAGLEERPGLRRELYAIDRLVCAVAPDHPLAGAVTASFEQILAHDLVSLERSSSNFLYLSNQARISGNPMRVRVHVQNFSAVLYMVEAGVGAAIVPASVAASATHQGRIATLEIIDPWAARELYLVHALQPAQPDLVREFAAILLNDPQIVAARGGA